MATTGTRRLTAVATVLAVCAALGGLTACTSDGPTTGAATQTSVSTGTPAAPVPTPVKPVAVTDPRLGVLDPYPTAPRVAWTSAWQTMAPGWSDPDASGPPLLGDVTATPHTYPGFRSLAVAGTWVVAVGVPINEWLVGLDATTGAALWHRPSLGPDGLLGCGGASPDGLVVCLGSAGAPELQLLEPTTGTVRRTVPVGFAADSVVVVGTAAVVHGIDGDPTTVRWEAVDLTTGSVRWDRSAAGAVNPSIEVGDGLVQTVVTGDVVLLRGAQYSLAVDARTGERLDTGLGYAFASRPDGVVIGLDDTGMVASTLGGAAVPLPGDGMYVPRVWWPDPDATAEDVVPVLTAEAGVNGSAGALHAVDPRTGDVLWTAYDDLVAQGVVGDAAVVIDVGTLSVLDLATGRTRWSGEVGDAVGYDGEHLVVARLHSVDALDLVDGSVAWSVPVEPGTGAALVAGTLVLTTSDGALTALTP